MRNLLFWRDFKYVGLCCFASLVFVATAAVISSNRVAAGGPEPSFGLLSKPNILSFSSAGSINVTVRDSRTGERVAALLRSISSDGDEQRTATDALGKGIVAAKGRTDVRIEAPGFAVLDTYFIIDGNALDVTVYLDPVEIPEKLRPEAIEADLREGETIFHGHIYDAVMGTSVADARIFIEGIEGEAVTDAKGYFKLLVRTPPIDPNGDMPAESDLVVVVDGVERQRRCNILVEPGASHFIIDLKHDEAQTIDSTHKFRLSPEEQVNTQTTPPESLFSRAMPDEAEAVAVPASIRVGLNCPTGSATTCPTIGVFSMDTYVRNGLNDEWIASWSANSLKAGAIAFRSYGAYHVNHPRTATYDICSNTSCQVMDTDTHANSDSATAQTVGSVVVNAAGTDFLRSEYSAENNLAPGCPDGNTCRPEHDWPCLADPVDSGQTFFGHGRGMCQWGTQRWSINQGKDFVWIVNHYYNANGNPAGLRNGIFQMGADTLLPPPTLTEPGNTTAPGTTISSLTPTFQWEPMTGADGYSLYVSKFNGTTYDVVFNSETGVGQPITGTSFTLPAGILVNGGEYRWNMSADIPAGYGTPNTFRNYFSVTVSATVAGKVTSPTGIGLRNAVVTMTDAQGVRRTATTSSFGLYSFSDVRIGESYTIGVSSKRDRFTPKVLQINGNLSNEDFLALE